MNFLDGASTTNYSTRAAAASGCAADQGRFLGYAQALFLSQPPEGGPGLTDAELAGIGRDIGLPDAAFASCVTEGLYLDWPAYVTARATALGVEGTPTVLVAGTAVQPDPRAIAAAVRNAAARWKAPALACREEPPSVRDERFCFPAKAFSVGARSRSPARTPPGQSVRAVRSHSSIPAMWTIAQEAARSASELVIAL